MDHQQGGVHCSFLIIGEFATGTFFVVFNLEERCSLYSIFNRLCGRNKNKWHIIFVKKIQHSVGIVNILSLQALEPLRRPIIVPTSEKLIFFGGGDPRADFEEDLFLCWLLSARVSSSSSSSSEEESVITIASAGFGAAGLIVADLILALLL